MAALRCLPPPLLLLLLLAITATTAGASDASLAATDDDTKGGGVQLMLESVKEIASCPGARVPACMRMRSWHRLLTPTPRSHMHARRQLPPLHALEPVSRHDGLRRPLRAWTGACVHAIQTGRMEHVD